MSVSGSLISLIEAYLFVNITDALAAASTTISPVLMNALAAASATVLLH